MFKHLCAVCAVEGAPNLSFEGTPTFDVKIEGALEVTIELHLKMHMVCMF